MSSSDLVNGTLTFVLSTFHLVVPEWILLDPFVTDSVEDEVFQTTQQIHSAVVLTTVRCLDKRIQPIDILVRDHINGKSSLSCTALFVYSVIYRSSTVILIRSQLRNPYADFRLSLVAILGKLREEHPGTPAACSNRCLMAKQFGSLPLDKAVVSGKDIGRKEAMISLIRIDTASRNMQRSNR